MISLAEEGASFVLGVGHDLWDGLDLGEWYAQLLGELVDLLAGQVFHPVDDQFVNLVGVARHCSHQVILGETVVARESCETIRE